VIYYTHDEAIIRSILEDESVKEGFDGIELLDDLFAGGAVYFYDPDVGLMPCLVDGLTIEVHAAIPKENRGAKAVRFGRELLKRLSEQGYNVTTVIGRNKKHVQRYAALIGFSFDYEDNKAKYYRVM
jgi:hypothetical protein